MMKIETVAMSKKTGRISNIPKPYYKIVYGKHMLISELNV